jgi:Protein of unknown function (DUF3100)
MTEIPKSESVPPKAAIVPPKLATPSYAIMGIAAILILVVAALAEIIKRKDIPVPGLSQVSLTLLPMVFALLIASFLSIQKWRPMPLVLQKTANVFLSGAVMFLLARLAFNIGPGMPTVIKAGPALFLQEIGHLLGTVFLALPLAVLLRMGRATIGATFSLDREPAFAMVNEKYGPDSDQYRGVLAMYVFGTLFGAIYITLLTSLVASGHVFDPAALAMGSGVGSGSMMAASLGTIISQFPDRKVELSALAAASNLITTVLGVYVGIFVALPLADRFYHFLTRNRDRVSEEIGAGMSAEDNMAFREQVALAAAPVSMPKWILMPALALIGVIVSMVNIAISGKPVDVAGNLVGYLLMVVLILVGIGLHQLFKPISSIVWITTIGAFISSQWMFGGLGPMLSKFVSSIDFLSVATVALACAGLSVGKDIPLLRRIGWKIIPVGLVSITASFLLATVIAEFTLGIWQM